ncbi:hypothetical protein [Flagellimonas sp.]|uniref:hypothetical protein n=1 Tax=Flagellimonas sp. TaxID=2058762 RepID=UPI003B51F4F4
MTNTLQSNLRATIDLRCNDDGDHPVHHFIYGSQLYGTVFAIYGKFNIEPEADGNKCIVLSIELKLINYKGLINIGFTKRKPILHRDRKSIFFGVQGASKITTQTICFRDPLVVGSAPYDLIFKRLLYPLKGFKFSLRERLCHGNIEKPLGKPIPHKKYFDSEFYYRNGDEYFYRALRPGMYGFEGVTLKKIAKKNKEEQMAENSYNGNDIEDLNSDKEINLVFASPRCHQSNTVMTF